MTEHIRGKKSFIQIPMIHHVTNESPKLPWNLKIIPFEKETQFQHNQLLGSILARWWCFICTSTWGDDLIWLYISYLIWFKWVWNHQLVKSIQIHRSLFVPSIVASWDHGITIIPLRRQSFLGPGASVDGRLLRGTCNVFGTKFDLQNGEAPMGDTTGRGETLDVYFVCFFGNNAM